MKGIVLNFPPRFRHGTPRKVISAPDVSGFIRRYGTISLYTICFAVGMIIGSVTARNASESLLNNMDFLFTTNLDARLSQPMYMTFVSSFSSNFLFLLCVFLLGISAWGVGAMLFVPMFKGFGTGLSAGYLFINFGIKGLGFYLLVILGGAFLFCFALILECTQAHYMSMKLARGLFLSKESVEPLRVFLRSYLLRSLYMLLLTVAASLADMLLWSAFAKLFFN